MTVSMAKTPSWARVHFWILPRHFALPAALCPVLLGTLWSGGPTAGLILALLAAACLMWSLHCWNSVVDWLSGVDKPGGSVEKPYTSGSQVLPQGWAPLWAVIANAATFFSLAVGFTVWLTLLAHSWWPFFGFGMGFVFGAFYSPIWKYWCMPEACGLLGFGVGGTALGMSVSGQVPLKEAFLLGVAISLPFAVSWGVDQAYDAASDVQRGVRNIGGLLHVTGFPTWAYTGIGALFTYAYVVFLVAIGVLGPWAGLTFLAVPAWIVCLAWLHASQNTAHPRQTKALDLGVRWGLIAILIHMVALVVATAV